MLGPEVYQELDERLAPVDAELRRRYPGGVGGRQPVHTVYLPADLFRAGTVTEWGEAALASVHIHPPSPIPPALESRVLAKLDREPIEDLRIDFEDGYGLRDDATEDADARRAASIVRHGIGAPFVGIRCKSLEPATRHRAIR